MVNFFVPGKNKQTREDAWIIEDPKELSRWLPRCRDTRTIASGFYLCPKSIVPEPGHAKTGSCFLCPKSKSELESKEDENSLWNNQAIPTNQRTHRREAAIWTWKSGASWSSAWTWFSRRTEELIDGTRNFLGLYVTKPPGSLHKSNPSRSIRVRVQNERVNFEPLAMCPNRAPVNPKPPEKKPPAAQQHQQSKDKS